MCLRRGVAVRAHAWRQHGYWRCGLLLVRTPQLCAGKAAHCAVPPSNAPSRHATRSSPLTALLHRGGAALAAYEQPAPHGVPPCPCKAQRVRSAVSAADAALFATPLLLVAGAPSSPTRLPDVAPPLEGVCSFSVSCGATLRRFQHAWSTYCDMPLYAAGCAHCTIPLVNKQYREFTTRLHEDT